MIDWRADQPYNDLPPLPPAAEVETRPVLKQCIAARAALAELKQAAAQMDAGLGRVVELEVEAVRRLQHQGH